MQNESKNDEVQLSTGLLPKVRTRGLTYTPKRLYRRQYENKGVWYTTEEIQEDVQEVEMGEMGRWKVEDSRNREELYYENAKCRRVYAFYFLPEDDSLQSVSESVHLPLYWHT